MRTGTERRRPCQGARQDHEHDHDREARLRSASHCSQRRPCGYVIHVSPLPPGSGAGAYHPFVKMMSKHSANPYHANYRIATQVTVSSLEHSKHRNTRGEDARKAGPSSCAF